MHGFATIGAAVPAVPTGIAAVIGATAINSTYSTYCAHARNHRALAG